MPSLINTTHPTSPSEYDKEFANTDKTPNIDYVHGTELEEFRDQWYDDIEALTRAEPHLLTKTREDLKPTVQERRIVIAVDRAHGDRVVGCIVLWPLCHDEKSQMWCELGTFMVIPAYRYGRTGLPIGDGLYHHLLQTNRDKNILGTTTNLKAIHTGMRHGMHMISFHQLPSSVHRATCICPIEKTGASDNLYCRIKNGRAGFVGCHVRVSTPTWERMGRPQTLPLTF
ncbi:hypothetical protein HY626_02110 [Candidatus Uhrbacteria bacterium]|nr:hypothetical protein [Candidatus Uhrbacteria bacterium]